MVKIMAKKKRRYKKKKTTSKLDIAVVTLILLSVLLGVLIYTKSGIIGVELNHVFGGIIGIMQYILPIGTFAIAIKLASEGKEEITSKLIQYAIAIVSLSIVFSVFQVSAGELHADKEISEVVKDAYNFGAEGKGGGAVGAVGAVALVRLLGNIGAVILCTGIAIILLVFAFGINPSEIINNIMDRIEEKRQEKFERKQEKIKQQEDEETPAQRRKRQREERKAQQEIAKMEQAEKDPMASQIKINFGGRIVDGVDRKSVV